MKKLLIFICSFFLLAGCSKAPVLQKQTFTIELGEDVYANPALYVKDAEKYDTEKMKIVALSSGIRKKDNRFVTGAQEYLVAGEYNFRLENGSQKIDFKIKIKDTKPPTVLKSTSSITVPQGTLVNWENYFNASDISGIAYSMSPILDTTNKGEYTILLKISDRFGNSTEHEVTVRVE